MELAVGILRRGILIIVHWCFFVRHPRHVHFAASAPIFSVVIHKIIQDQLKREDKSNKRGLSVMELSSSCGIQVTRRNWPVLPWENIFRGDCVLDGFLAAIACSMPSEAP